MNRQFKHLLSSTLMIFTAYQISTGGIQKKPDFNFYRNNPITPADTLYKLQKSYTAQQNMHRKRVSPDGTSNVWDVIIYDYQLKIAKDSTFLLEKGHNNYTTSEYGKWRRNDNYLLLEIRGFQSGKKRTYYDSTYKETWLIRSDSTLFNDADRLLFICD